MAHRPRQRGQYYTWRRPAPGEEPLFELFVNWRWPAMGALLALPAALTLGALSPERRARNVRRLVGAAMGAGVLAIFEGMRGAAFPTLKRITLPLRDLPAAFEGFTIGQLTDLHLGVLLTGQSVPRAVAALMAAHPDLIVLTGDYISFRRHLPRLRDALQPLAAPYGIYAIFGNHDGWTDRDAIAELLRGLHIQTLIDEHQVIALGGDRLVVAGVDDMWDGTPDLEAALRGVPAEAPIILLAHAPDYADEAAQTPVAVQLAGHTHAGHIRLPGLGPLFLPRHGTRYDRGLHRVGQMWLYVSHGVGGWPLRIGCRGEVTVFTLRKE